MAVDYYEFSLEASRYSYYTENTFAHPRWRIGLAIE
jgi:hypothetical protein